MRHPWPLALALVFSTANAEPVALEFGRYLSKYPGMYSTWSYSDSARDTVFDANGRETNSVTPTFGPGVAFPEQRGTVQLEWHFPWFETEALPFISSRLWTARATLGYSKLGTDGPINNFVAADPPREGLVSKTDGLTDIQLAFGPTLYGSDNWRERKSTPLSVVLLGQFSVPTGERDPGSPNNAGSNVFSWGATLGAHAQWSGFLLDAGLGQRLYTRNEEPAFGGHEPTRRGADTVFDATVARKLISGWYLSASYSMREGDANEYSNVRFANNPPAASIGNETFPDPATQRDGGTDEQRLDLAAHWFARPDLRLSLRYVLPQSGSSGEFNLPYLQQQQNCQSSNNCNPQPNGSRPVDGLGSARTYASDYWMLTITYSHEQGDFWL